MSSLEEARAAKALAVGRFGSVPGIRGIGITRIGKGYGLKINVEDAESGRELPAEVEGVPVRVEVVGRVGYGDYAAEREALFGHLTLGEIVELSRRYGRGE